MRLSVHKNGSRAVYLAFSMLKKRQNLAMHLTDIGISSIGFLSFICLLCIPDTIIIVFRNTNIPLKYGCFLRFVWGRVCIKDF